ncbi:homeobox protein YOX1/YHP1 [Microdochium nivale]|nr:homeobox protein YOX1/YHP1 [Microdochium nivale]
MADSTLPENNELPPLSSPSSISPDSSALSLQSSFRLDSGFAGNGSDSEKHPKGKRKRTTSRDKTILEASYLANAKPDKAARLDIVRRVSLSEKEVQIWFQNRRQNDRRKSRPLSAEEIAALRYGGAVQILSADSSFMVNDTADQAPSSFNLSQESISSQQESTPAGAATPPRSTSPRLAEPMRTPALGSAVKLGMQPYDFINMPSSSQKSEPEGLSQTTPFSTSVGYLSNRWNMSNSFSTPTAAARHDDDDHRFDFMPSSACSTHRNSTSSIFAGRTPSQFRLSLSLEGKAELVSSQPSPPRPLAAPLLQDTTPLPPVRLNRTLHRSRSSPLGVTLPPISTLTAHLPPQLSRGRSRDVHAWESCCDADDRDELTKLAESESSGSAVAAISLLRSSSSSASLNSMVQGTNAALCSSPVNSILQSNPNKRNAPCGKSHARSGSWNKKPKISRTTSSVARMQTMPLPHPDKENEVQARDELEPEKKAASNKSSLAVILSPTADSDKENWSPDAEGNPVHRRRAPSTPSTVSKPPPVLSSNSIRRMGRILGEHLAPLNKRANTAPSLSKGSHAREVVDVFEDGENAEDREEEHAAEGDEGGSKQHKKPSDADRIVRGEASPGKKGDLDCIAGLLSLSQGNWR